MSMVERVARVLCKADRCDPDQLEPGDAAGIDGHLSNGDPAHFLWREWSDRARLVIEAMREPTDAMKEESFGSDPFLWGRMIDAATNDPR